MADTAVQALNARLGIEANTAPNQAHS